MYHHLIQAQRILTMIVVLLTGLSCASFADDTDRASTLPTIQAAVAMNSVETEILRLINQVRTSHGLRSLAPHPALVLTSRDHSQEMQVLRYFDHVSPTPGLVMPWDRVERSGFQTLWVAENLYEADGYAPSALPELILDSWMASPSHRANLLDARNVFSGVGVVQRGSRVMVTQIFSGPEDTDP